MKISVFGLGYVGAVSAACLAQAGHEIVGVDINQFKVDTINSGNSPVLEPGLADLISQVVASGNLRATTDAQHAVINSEVSLICVGTPGQSGGLVDLTQVERVCDQIGAGLKMKTNRHTVIVRSTVLPGTIEGIVSPRLEQASSKKVGRDFILCGNPEFLREGTSLEDFYAPPFTLVGAANENDAATLRDIFGTIDAPLLVVDIKTAEMVKYACNSFHALKVAFANEIGSLCDAIDIDADRVMETLCNDTKLNLSAAYLKPGFAFGGSCLPKDMRALVQHAGALHVETPLLLAINVSNRTQLDRAVETVLKSGSRRVGLLGLSFKAGTDDLRESPLVALVARLVERKIEIKIFDPDVSVPHLVGANRKYFDNNVADLEAYICENLGEVVQSSELIIVGKACDEFRGVESELRADQLLIDLAGMCKSNRLRVKG